MGIDLIHIFEDEWDNKQDIIKNMIANRLGQTKKIYGRNTTIKEVEVSDKNKFLNDNHLQGEDKSRVKIGLYHKNELVAITTWGKPRFNKNYEWELIRYCNKIGYSVVGGFSKMLKYFTNTYNVKSIITYADRRYSKGNVYLKNGFTFIKNSKPNYFYVIGNTREGRVKYQKHKLGKLFSNFDSKLTEVENMKKNGFYRIFDSGNKVFIWER